jgi:hypothetical protein
MGAALRPFFVSPGVKDAPGAAHLQRSYGAAKCRATLAKASAVWSM